MRTLLATAILFTAMHAGAATPAYDEAADAKAEIKSTLVQAQRAKVPVLVVFGANWCGDCKVLDMAFKSGASAPLVQKELQSRQGQRR